jgi:hypothetical protein
MNKNNDDDTVDTPAAALRWAVESQRCLAFNLGYLDVPAPEMLPEGLTWQMLSALHDTEFTLINDFVIRRIQQGEQLTPEYSGSDDDDIA